MAETICGRCHRVLTATESIYRGLGPVCYKAIQEEVEHSEMKGSLSDHYMTVMKRFLQAVNLGPRERSKWIREAAMAVNADSKESGATLAYDLIHHVLNRKISLGENGDRAIKLISNLLDISGQIRQATQQEKFLLKFYRDSKRINDKQLRLKRHPQWQRR